MELTDLIETVGSERYDRARRLAWATAAAVGSKEEDAVDPAFAAELDQPYQDPETHAMLTVREDAGQVMYDLGAEIWWDQDDLSRVEKVELTFQLYRDMPNYSPLAQIHSNRPRPGDPVDPNHDDYLWALWKEMRALLQDADERLSRPVEYVLWADWFEDPETVDEAWGELVEQTNLNEVGMQRLLVASGPVPYERKAELYARLREPRWHPWIFESLRRSCGDYFGKTDHVAALGETEKLELPEQMRPAVEAFKNHLTKETIRPGSNRQPEGCEEVSWVALSDVIRWEQERGGDP